MGTEKEFLKNFAAGLISLFQRPTFPQVAVWYPVSDGGDTFPNCEIAGFERSGFDIPEHSLDADGGKLYYKYRPQAHQVPAHAGGIAPVTCRQAC